jgi:hypothetical protein
VISARNFERKNKKGFEMNYVLKYITGEFVGEDRASGGYPYRTKNLTSARMFDDLSDARVYLSLLKSQFPNDSFSDNVYEVVVRSV